MPFPSPVPTNHHDVYPAISPSNPELSQAGKVVVITGGGQGVGRALAEAFVTAGAAHVVLLGRTASTLEAAKQELTGAGSSKIHTFSADVTDEARTEAVFAEIHKSFGPIDVVVANAGYMASASYAQHSVDEFRKNFEINVIGTFILSQAFLRHKNPAPTSTFISLNTGAAHLPYMMPAVGYSTSKAATARLVEMLQGEHPEIRAFSMVPGVIKTEMSKKGGMYDAANDEAALPAGLAVYLSSPKADWLKGRFVWSHWDVDELEKKYRARLEKDPILLTFALTGWPFDGDSYPSPFD